MFNPRVINEARVNIAWSRKVKLEMTLSRRGVSFVALCDQMKCINRSARAGCGDKNPRPRRHPLALLCLVSAAHSYHAERK
jgi:hypothetical protein